MLKGAGDNIKNENLHKQAWIADIFKALDIERTFKGEDPVKFLDAVWENIISGHSIKTIDGSNYIGTSNIAKNKVLKEYCILKMESLFIIMIKNMVMEI